MFVSGFESGSRQEGEKSLRMEGWRDGGRDVMLRRRSVKGNDRHRHPLHRWVATWFTADKGRDRDNKERTHGLRPGAPGCALRVLGTGALP